MALLALQEQLYVFIVRMKLLEVVGQVLESVHLVKLVVPHLQVLPVYGHRPLECPGDVCGQLD